MIRLLCKSKLTFSPKDQDKVRKKETMVREREEALAWLSTFQYQKKHNDVRATRTPETGSWLLENKTFRKWRDDPQSQNVLWCHGTPGAGKTILS